MKVKVISQFKDKYTKEVYKVGKELEVTKDRYEAIRAFVEKQKNNKKK